MAMDSFGKNAGVPILALLLVAVIGVAMRYAPENAAIALPPPETRPPLVTTPSAETAPILGGGLSDPLKHAAEFGIETFLPPIGAGFSAPIPMPDTPAPPLFAQKQPRSTHVLSDYEVFTILHPPYYLRYLSTLEDLMIQDVILRQDEKRVFDSEDKVIVFLRDKVFDYIVLKGITVPEDRARFERGLEVVQELHLEEANYLRYGTQSSKYRIVAFWESVYERIRGWSGSQDVFAGLFLPRARAQAECVQVGVPNPAPGSNNIAICCNCTINKVPAGCLNAVCGGRPAIWDEPTGICGCG